MKSPRKYPTLCFGGAFFALTAAAPLHAAPVFSGGTESVAEHGMIDLSVSANSANFRALGGQLYIYPIVWNATSGGMTTRTAIKNLFPASPMVESGGSGGAADFFLAKLKTPGYWTKADSNIDNGISDYSDAAMASLVSSWAPYTNYVAPVGPEDGAIPFSDATYDQYRRNCLAGGIMTVDLPPQFYFDKPASFRVFIADEIQWPAPTTCAWSSSSSRGTPAPSSRTPSTPWTI